jgi:hypothetical protein
MAQPCTNCRGSGLNPFTNNTSICPLCDGSGRKFDPGREMTYEMGPFTLNAAAAASTTVPNYAVGAASTNSILNGVTCMVANWPFRWMFALSKQTFPFTVQIKDAGSGSGRSFVPQSLQVHSGNLFGTSERPMPLPTPYVFRNNQNITADFTDLGGAVGFVNVTSGAAAITWNSGGIFNTAAAPGPPYPNNPLWNGATISIGGVLYVISAVTSQTTLTLATNYLGATSGGGGTAYAVSNTIRVAFKGVELSDASAGNNSQS